MTSPNARRFRATHLEPARGAKEALCGVSLRYADASPTRDAVTCPRCLTLAPKEPRTDKRDHCRLDLQGMRFVCWHCGATQPVKREDLELRRIARLGDAWGELHERCPKQEARSAS